MKFEEQLEELKDVIEELTLANESAPIIVEGEKDKEALQLLGINGKIVALNRGQSIPSFCDLLASKYNEVILLMDWDKKGRKLTHIVEQNLRGRIKLSMEVRYKFAKIVGVRTVEGIPSYFKTLSSKVGKH